MCEVHPEARRGLWTLWDWSITGSCELGTWVLGIEPWFIGGQVSALNL